VLPAVRPLGEHLLERADDGLARQLAVGGGARCRAVCGHRCPPVGVVGRQEQCAADADERDPGDAADEGRPAAVPQSAAACLAGDDEGVTVGLEVVAGLGQGVAEPVCEEVFLGFGGHGKPPFLQRCRSGLDGE
jgi:hypothetical protein